jgi:hypothetical protein
MDGLLAMHGEDDSTKSILSSQLVVDISARYLTQRYQSHVDPPPQQHPASARLLRLGLALANLNGVDYGLPLLPKLPDGSQDKFIYTQHQDELVTWIETDKPDIDDILGFWEPLRNAAVSCGAFPLAFRVVDVIRHASEYTDPSLVSNILPSQNFAYTDGGTFQNEPLGLAKNLVDLIDHHQNMDSRFYLFVAPGTKSSTANANFNAANADFRKTALQLISSIFNQARFQDWIMAEGINAKIALYNQRAAQLHVLMRENKLNASSLESATTALLPLLFSSESMENQAQAWQRVHDQFSHEYDDLLQGNGKPTADSFIDTLLTLESSAQLGASDEMTIYGITASDAELASSELCSFAGFFDQRYRDHDYDVGRQKAQTFLKNPGALGPINFTPEDIRPIDPALNGLKLENMDRDVRTAMRDRLRDRAHEILKEAGVNPWLVGGAVREAIDLALIKPQLDKLLKLS